MSDAILNPDATNDPARRSWLASANARDADFPLQNLPLGVFRPLGAAGAFRGGVAIGDRIVDLAPLAASGILTGEAAQAAALAAEAPLNRFMRAGPTLWQALRRGLFEALAEGSALEATLRPYLIPQAEAEQGVPARIGDYTDFYSSIHHATAVGRLMRPDNPLTPNYKWLPIGYHGRCSSIGVSGQCFNRPLGQRLPPGQSQPVVGPSRRLDYELELGVFIGTGNEHGQPIPIAAAEEHIFGLCVLNDWSARDLQAFEYQPLGPFLSKSFATTISPWIVSLQALAPFRVPRARPAGDPELPAYLRLPGNGAAGGIDIQLETALESTSMRARGEPPQRLARTSYRHAYWTLAQLIAHHTINGCNLEPGDLLGTGTQSGPEAAEAGSLLELTQGGKQPFQLGSSEQRTFLEDGDTVVMRAWCERAGSARIGFGEARGRVLPAR